MSFEVYMQCYKRGAPASTSMSAIREAFAGFLDESDPQWWLVRYDESNSSDILVSRDAHGDISSLTIHRPCGDQRLWDAMYNVLQLGSWVLYFPAETPLLIVADRSVEAELPPDMLEAIGPVTEVRSGIGIVEAIHDS